MNEAASFDGPEALRRRIAELEAENADLRESIEATSLSGGNVTATALAAMLEHLPVGVGVIDGSGSFTLRNPAIGRYVSNQMPSRDGTEGRWRAYHPDGRRVEPDEYPGARALRGEAVLPGIDFLFRQDDGREVWTRVAAVPISDAGQGGQGAMIVIQDIDGVKRTADKLAASLEELVASEAQMRLVADSVPALVSFIGNDLRYRFVNRAYEQWFGAPRGAVEGRHIRDVLGETAFEGLQPRLLAVLQGEHVSFEAFVPYKDGGTRHVQAEYIPNLTPSGEIDGYFGFVVDVTQRKKDEAALLEARSEAEGLAAERAAILAQLSEGVIVTDPAGRIVFVNQAAAELHGGAEIDVGPDAYAETYHLFTEDGRPYPAEELPLARAVRDGEIVSDARWRIRRPDGTEVLAIGSARPVFAPGGARLGAVLTMRDDTQRHAAEEALAGSERRLAAVLDNTTMAVFMMDDRQHCIYMNAAAEGLTGFRFEETQRRPLHDVVHHTYPDGRPFPLEECAIDRALPTNHQTQGEEVFIHKDGHFFPVAFTASPIHDERGKAVGTVLEVRDITVEKENDARVQLLIGELNHRVKNTLATVQSIAWQALRGKDVPPHVREAIEARLIALSRSHDLLTREAWGHAGLRDLACEALEPFGVADGRAQRFSIDGPNIRLRPQVALALGMAFHELATNAVKHGAFSNDSGTVRLTWTIDRKTLRLTWEEHGGPPVEEPKNRGFGSRLIERGLAYELDGVVHLAYPREGVVCTVEMPVDNARGP